MNRQNATPETVFQSESMPDTRRPFVPETAEHKAARIAAKWLRNASLAKGKEAAAARKNANEVFRAHALDAKVDIRPGVLAQKDHLRSRFEARVHGLAAAFTRGTPYRACEALTGPGAPVAMTIYLAIVGVDRVRMGVEVITPTVKAIEAWLAVPETMEAMASRQYAREQQARAKVVATAAAKEKAIAAGHIPAGS